MRVKRFKMISYVDPPQVYFLFFIFSYYYYFSFYRRPALLPPLSFTIGPTAQRKSTDILEGKTFSLFFSLHIFYFFNLTDEKMYIKNRHVPDGKSLHTSLYVFRLFLKVNSLFLSSFVLSYFIFFPSLGLHAVVSHFPFVPFPLFSLFLSFPLHHLPILFLQYSYWIFLQTLIFFYPLFQLFLSYFHPLLFASFTRSKLLTLFLTIFENTFGG